MDQTEIELQLALDRIAELNQELGRNPTSDTLFFRLTDPVQLAAARLIREVKKSIRDAENYPRDAKKLADLAARLLSKIPEEEDRRYEIEEVSRATRKYDEKKARADAHLAVLQQKLARLQSEPKSMFLPLGTHVRVNGKGKYASTVDPYRSAIFAQGTEGVVARLNSDSEYGIAVAVVGSYLTEGGDEMNASDTRPHVVHFDREQLDVIAYGSLPDGSPSEAYGFSPTYEMDDDDEVTEEMVILSNGLYWWFKRTELERGRVEVTCAYESLDALPGTLRPLEGSIGLRM